MICRVCESVREQGFVIFLNTRAQQRFRLYE
jgi:hypothetical protein